MASQIMFGKREFGDYQTPAYFAKNIVTYLQKTLKIAPSAIIEPTCGVGNFLKGCLSFATAEIYGIEINSEYCEVCKRDLQESRVHIINANIFGFETKKLITDTRNILIIGNPPWATNSMLSSGSIANLPQKQNFKSFSGIDAVTGASNFDICESIILQLVREYAKTNTTVAMLCKTSVARNIFKELIRTGETFTRFDVLEFDASKIFGISASSCLLVIQLTDKETSLVTGKVYSFETPDLLEYEFGFVDGKFYSDIRGSAYNFDGQSCFEWRQGVKHDCSKVMELKPSAEGFVNALKERVEIEEGLIFPLVKSSMFKQPIISSFSKYVIVTQKKVGDNTVAIKAQYPKTWEYLQNHKPLFDKRMSIIYQKAPMFAMFGVGDYSYSKYKVGVSGFYKNPLFSVLYSDDGKPVMTDDTAYFICFQTYDDAYITMLFLNSAKTRSFLRSISFVDAKRPYTKAILGRLDFKKMVDEVSYSDLVDTEAGLKLKPYLTHDLYIAYCRKYNFIGADKTHELNPITLNVQHRNTNKQKKRRNEPLRETSQATLFSASECLHEKQAAPVFSYSLPACAQKKST